MLRKDATAEIRSSRIPRSLKSGLLALALLAAVGAGGCAASGAKPAEGWSRKPDVGDLREAGKRLGVPIRSEGTLQFTQRGATLLAAPAANLETIAPPRYASGVDLGVAYLDLPGPVDAGGTSRVRIPKGFYKLRAFADEVRQVGKVGGHVQLMNAEGRVLAELPADVDIRSLILPPEAATERTLLTINTSSAGTESASDYVVVICFHCSNGAWVCFFIRIYPSSF
jgi:hypothetical protein